MPPLTRSDFERGERHLLNRGRFANATVWRVVRGDAQWVVKDFSRCPWPLRWTLGVWLARRERRVLERLAGIEGVPADVFRLDGLALGYRFIPGRSLRQCPPGALNRDFFEHLETLVRRVHARGCAHLDLRNARNHLVRDDGSPALIDFQSALAISRLPAAWRLRLERVDLSGVYKHWAAHDPQGLGSGREQVLLWQLRTRRWWRLRGYRLPGRARALHDFERRLLQRAGEEKK